MPSGSKKRKAAKKKKEEEVVLTACYEDSANQHDHGHGNENDDDDISPKTPVQATERDGSSSDAEAGSPNHDEFKQDEQIQENSFTDIEGYQYHPVESSDISLVVSDNRSESSSDVLVHVNNGPIESSAPFTDPVEPHLEEDRDINMESLVQSSDKYDGDETQGSELDARTDVSSVFISSEIGCGDESKLQVLSSEEVEDNHNQIQSAGSFTDLCGHSLAEATYITVGSQSHALDVSDDDESKLEVVSSTAVIDPNESVQSLGSADSPRSFQSMNSLQFSEQNSCGRVILTSEEKECESEGVLETPWNELNIETNIPFSLYHVDAFESSQDQDGQAKSSKESSLDFRNEEHIQVGNEVRIISHTTLEEGLAELVGNSEQIQGASLISSVASVTESELISTVEENTLFESNVMAVPMIKNEASKVITEPVISTDGEINRDDLGSSPVEDHSSDAKENATEEAASHPQKVGKKVCIVSPHDQDGQANSFKESSEFKNEHIQVTNEVRTFSHATLEEGLTELVSNSAIMSPQDQDGQANSLFKESSLDLRNEEHIHVTNQVCTLNHAISEEGLTELVINSEQTQGISLISSVAAVTESEPTRTVEENTLLDSNVMAAPLIKTESSKAMTKPMLFTGTETSRDDLGSSQVEDNPSDTKENATEEAALYPQNVGKKNAVLFQREPRTSWMSCCGILDIFTRSHS